MYLSSEAVVAISSCSPDVQRERGWGRCNHPPLPCSLVDVFWLTAWESTKFNIIIQYLVPTN